ncbi:MAG: polysaccharide deacetylase family protein [Defluviitaleaceae bacterium]|nr:polysaccharide deacetylase family protein [Defluviitaleaceae bacterium]
MKNIFVILMALAMLTAPLETLGGLPIGATAEVPIIMYHALEDNPSNRWEITVAEFESDLQWLSENGYTAVFMQDVIDFVHLGKPLPEKPIVLSFDDGRQPAIDIMLPMLEAHDSRITMAIIGAMTDKYTQIAMESNRTQHPHMTWDCVRKAIASGRVEIQSHTYDLHGARGVGKKNGEDLCAYKARLLGDLEKFAQVLVDNVGLVSNCLTYPLGILTEVSDEIIRDAGYLASLSCYEKPNTITVGDYNGLFALNRYLRPPHKSSESFFRGIL